jgi:hypothetical protein
MKTTDLVRRVRRDESADLRSLRFDLPLQRLRLRAHLLKPSLLCSARLRQLRARALRIGERPQRLFLPRLRLLDVCAHAGE